MEFFIGLGIGLVVGVGLTWIFSSKIHSKLDAAHAKLNAIAAAVKAPIKP
jgi:formylmethanofuran:tetrahydromethanopterin formyltransferase